MRYAGAFLLVLLSLSVIHPGVAHAEDFALTARLKRDGSHGKIANLNLAAGDIPLKLSTTDSKDAQIQLAAEIRGTFKARDSILLYHGNKVELASSGPTRAFVLTIPIQAAVTHAQLSSVDPYGKVQQEELLILFPGWAAYQALRRQSDLPSKHSFGASLGLTSFSYSESAGTNVNLFSQIGLTLKGSYGYKLSKSVDLGGTVFLTALGVGSKLAGVTAKAYGIDSASVRTIGMNGRIGYTLPQIRQPWQLDLMTGIYYTSMIVSPKIFGFRNLMGPELFPTLRRLLPSGDSVSAYLKYSPIGQNFSLLSLSNRELAFGISYSRPKGASGHAVTFALDLAQLSDLVEGIQIDSTSLSLSAGLSF